MRKIYSLNPNWSFRKIEENSGSVEEGFMTGENVSLPHTWNDQLKTERGQYVYEKLLEVPEIHRGEKLFLEFQGANTVCTVYINSQFIGRHQGGYSTFRMEITSGYQWGKENRLQVVVDNGPTKDVSPLNGDFTIYGGLYRDVHLLCVQSSHFDLLFYGSQGVILRSTAKGNGQGFLQLEPHVVGGEKGTLRWEIFDAEGKLVKQQEAPAKQQNHTVTLEKVHLWQGKKNPYLYRLVATLLLGDEVCDRVELSFGFRECALDPAKGFFLNGERLRINGVAKHQDFGMLGNAVKEEQILEDFALIDEIGANGVRLSHYQHPQRTYDLCDEKGYITWAEIPMMAMPDDRSVLDNAGEQLKELVYQNCHHPSICFWGIQNEIAMGGESLAMYRGVHELNDLFHALLPHEISVSANMYYVKNDSSLNFITDALGYNLYYGWYYGQIEDLSGWFDAFHGENPSIPLGLSEYGADCNLQFHSETPKVKDYSEEYQALYHEKTYGIVQSKAYLWGSFVWNMFDFGSAVRDEGGTKGQNCKGLVTIDRKVRKDAFYYYKAQWSAEPFVHLCAKRFENRSGSTMTVKVYSNQKKVRLLVNGSSWGEKEGQTVFIFDHVPLQPGPNHLQVLSGGNKRELKDEGIFYRVEDADPRYVYADPHPGFNVANWFTQEKGELDVFPKGCYSIKDKIADLMASPEAWAVIEQRAPAIAGRSTPGTPVTLLWIFDKMRAVFTEEEIRAINDELVKIPKECNG